MTLRAEWITDEARWRELEPAWDDLVLRSRAPSIYSTWAFLEASWLHLARPQGDSLAVVAVFDGDDLLAVAPLRISRRRRLGVPVRRLGKLAAWESDRAQPLVCAGSEAECARAFGECLERHARRWDWLDFDELDPDGEELRSLSQWAAAARGMRPSVAPDPPSPFLDLSRGWGAVEESFGRHRRKELRKYLRALGEPGEWSFEIEEGESARHALASYLDVESRSWKKSAGQGVARNERTLAFYDDLLPRLACLGRASFAFLRRGDQRIAAVIEYRLGSTVWGIQKAYDAEAARLAPGNCLAVMTFERWAERGIASYELQGLYLDDKAHWTQLAHPRARFRIVQRRSWRQRLAFLLADP